YRTFQELTIQGSTISKNAGYGAIASVEGVGDFFDTQVVTSEYSTFGGNLNTGLSVRQQAIKSDYAAQIVTSYKENFVNNGGGGISVGQLLDHTYNGVQDVIVNGDYFTGPGD